MLQDMERGKISQTDETAFEIGRKAKLDPTLILTSNGSRNDIRRFARQVVATGDAWNGVSSAGVTASWDQELAEVSDDSPTFGAAQIPTYKAQAFIQAAIEAFEDISGLASDALMQIGRAHV